MVNEVVIHVREQGTAQTGAAINGLQKSTIAAGAAMGLAFAKVGEATIGFARDAILSFADVGSAIYDMSQRTGIGAEALSELKFAAEQSGTSMEAIGVAIKRVNTNMYEAAGGNKAAIESFQMLGLSMADFAGKDVAANFDLILEKLAGVQDKTMQSALAVKLFGKAGTDLLPMLDGGAAGLQAMRDRAHELGIVFDAEAAKKADDLGDTLDQLKGKLAGVGFQAGAVLGPIVVQLATVFVNLVTAISKNQYALAAIAGVIGTGLVVAIAALVAAIGVVPLALMAAVGGLAAGFLWIKNNIDGIKSAWADLWDSMPGFVHDAWDGIKGFFTSLTDAFKNAINFQIDVVNKLLGLLDKLPSWLGGGNGSFQIPHIEDIFKGTGALIGAGVEKAKGLASGLGASLPGLPQIPGAFDPEAIAAATEGTKEKMSEWQQNMNAILDEFMHKQVEAYLKGGDAAVEVVKKQQQATLDEIVSKATELHMHLGIKLPDALRLAAAATLDLSKAAEQAQRRVFDLTTELWSKFGGPGTSAAGFENLAALAALAEGKTPITGSIGEDGVWRSSPSSAGLTVVNNFNGIVGDPAAVGVMVADAVNAAAASTGAVISSGAVES